MTTDQLRIKFLNFFKRHNHTIVASDSLIPKHDPTLLFTGAGMNQFKDQFMARNVTFRRAATCQKCLRTADLENVGRTPGHHTFFEMLGNFAFGDYFKREAIEWAWEFLTRELKIPKERLWVSVYEQDTEAYGIWRDVIRIPAEKITRLGDKENFWPSEARRNGPNGPCGPCSEIFYDWGDGESVEIWNLVFTQFNRRDRGMLEPLPNKNIDTGMGLERLAAVMQNKRTNFGIDIFSPIIKAISDEIKPGQAPLVGPHLNAIADHIRAVTFAISDGVRPSNEGRGFVIRKLVRKASQRARALAVTEPFLYKIVPAVARAMKGAYPELMQREKDIAEVVLNEEVNLKEIVETLLPHVEEEIIRLKEENKGRLPGALIFKYYDEKGIPFDLIEERAKAHGLDLDTEGFNALLEGQKSRSREKSKVVSSIFVERLSDVSLKTEFLQNEKRVKAKVLAVLKKGDLIHIALDRTPFYGEAGGQAGDKGEISAKDLKVIIYDAKKYEDTIDHIGEINYGSISVGDEVEATIDVRRREMIKKNHTATHLLHSALRKVLGGHVRQYGSLVEEERFRFDFTHPAKVEDGQIERVEELVNSYIDKDIPVETAVMALEEAKRFGALALFGEKYKEKVMVRAIGDVSKELCGGTHVGRTGEIGLFKIISESSIASGVRRIEALTGPAVYKWLKEDIEKDVREYRTSLDSIKKALGSGNETINRLEGYLGPVLFNSEVIAKKRENELNKEDVIKWIKELKPGIMRSIDDLSRESKRMMREAKAKRLSAVKSDIEGLLRDFRDIGGVRVISREIEGADMSVLRGILDDIKARAGSAVVVLGSKDDSKANLVCGVTDDLIKRGLDASKIIRSVAALIAGTGGGRPDLAQAGGKDAGRLDLALAAVFKTVEEELAR